MKKILLAALVLPFVFSACSKSDSNSSSISSFAINGMHDITIDPASSTANILPLTITQTGSTQENVALSVTDLPSGISAQFDAVNGIPAFSSKLTFSTDYSTIAGTYPIHIVGKTSTSTKSYDLNLIMPQLNGWSFNNLSYTTKEAHVDSFYNSFKATSPITNISDQSDISFDFGNSLPTASGSYKVVAGSPSNGEVSINVFYSIGSGSHIYESTGTGNSTVKLNIHNGKMSVSFSNVEMVEGSTTVKLSGAIQQS